MEVRTKKMKTNKKHKADMQAKFTKESYALVEKLANKFAHGTGTIEYDKFVSDGMEGLIKAIDTFKNDGNAKFETYALTCIRNAMCSLQREMEKNDMEKDDNVVLEEIDMEYKEAKKTNEIESEVKKIFSRINNGNERNTRMVIMHIGMDGNDPMEYKDIAKVFDVTTERVRQVCRDTIRAIKSDKETMELIYGLVG